MIPKRLEQSLKKKIDFYFVDLETPIGRLVDFVIVSLILLSCILYVVETYALPASVLHTLKVIEWSILGVFAIEYFLRLWVAQHKIKHFFNVYSLIDLAAILPLFLVSNLQFIRIFRLLRIFRFTRFLQDRHFFFGNITESMLVAWRIVFTVFSIIFVSAGLMYHVEHAVNPELNTFFDATYYTVVTLATVGYGDITPISHNGRVVTVIMIISGMIFIPWQIAEGIRHFALASRKRKSVCKRCGLKYHDKDASHCKHCGKAVYQEVDGI